MCPSFMRGRKLCKPGSALTVSSKITTADSASLQKPGHKAGDNACESLLKEPIENLCTITGMEDPLSNFYMADLDVFGIKAKCAEHAYQYSKALHCGDGDNAKTILEARTVPAKPASRLLKPDPSWAQQKEEVMQKVLEAKAKQVTEFTDILLNTGSKTFVETVNGEILLGSGYDSELTQKTKKKFWLGQNKLGKLLEQLCSSLKKTKQRKRRMKRHQKQETFDQLVLGRSGQTTPIMRTVVVATVTELCGAMYSSMVRTCLIFYNELAMVKDLWKIDKLLPTDLAMDSYGLRFLAIAIINII